MLYKNIIHTVFIIMLTIVTSFFSSHVTAGLITFETNALGLTPEDNEIIPITSMFSIDGVNIRFCFDSNNNGVINKHAVFERAGNTNGDKKQVSRGR